ncbi:DNA-binding protein [Spiroplasma sp. TIUS-1]|uniref:YlxM family DNA-binding protein n=1 Tax=Spiroplasma sp. TIUS-1 TaxID=216963 RepID=UPI001398F97F|nr:sigma factor-like helix-turn-helix DNA-binding protein [Spiroplasma sp. TIUS-1]QHX35790.1 DNA-binding protein [Spiroplasma sp. TIUS-1]
MNNSYLQKTVEINQLFDFYKELLTTKQREYFEMYYFENYSLNEIAIEYGVSKNAIYDSLQKTIIYLENIEEKLMFNSRINILKDLASKEDVDLDLIKNKIMEL